ncbi:MAG TPA: hypothetical protein VLJ41_08210 [Segetibacter sp.]|nr:hypothetical protein [Segetibacter sp.]
MKQIAQLIALYLPGANAIQIMLAVAVVILLLRQFVEKTAESIKDDSVKKKAIEFENDLWAIE